MTEFETQNTLNVVVDDRSLTEARADVENALSSVPVDVEVAATGGGRGAAGRAGVETAASSSAPADVEQVATSGGSEVAAHDRARQRQLQSQQIESIEGLREELESEDARREWQRQHRLSRERNRLLRGLLEEEEDDDRRRPRMPRMPGAGMGVALGAVSLLGIGALSSVLSDFEWPSLPEAPEFPTPPMPSEPDWHPLDVVDPDPASVQEPEEMPVQDPGEMPVEEPGEATVEQPAEASVEEPAEASVEQPQDAQVAEPEWTPINLAMPEISDTGAADEIGNRVGVGGLLAGGAAGGAVGLQLLRNHGASAASRGASAGGAAFLTPEGLGMTDFSDQNHRRSQVNEFLDDRGVPEPFRLEELDPEHEHPGSVFSAEGREAQSEGFRDVVDRITDAIERVSGGGGDQRTEVSVESNVTVNGATRREVERAAEEAKQEAIRDVERALRGRR